MVSDELILLGICHLGQGVVLAGELSVQGGQGPCDHLLHLTALSARAVGWEAKALDAATCAYAGGQDVLLVQHATLDLSEVQVGLVLGVGGVAAMAGVDDGVQEILEDLVGLLVSSYRTNSEDEGVT